MEVAWEALLAQAQANRGLAQVALEGNASELEELARASRVMAEVLLVGVTKTHDCCEPVCRDELQAWFHDAHEVAAVGSALGLIGGTAVDKEGQFLGGCQEFECGKIHRRVGGDAAASVDAFTQCDPKGFAGTQGGGDGCSGGGATTLCARAASQGWSQELR